jgi:hypothetical protein
MSSKPDLAEALRSVGGGTRRRQRETTETTEAAPAAAPEDSGARPYRQPGREGLKPITVHFPKEVRDQLKMLAIREDTTLQELVAEAFNTLFANYGMPEVAPSSRKRR